MNFVGRSDRTPFKHWLLNAELGRQVGIFSNGASKKIPVKACPFQIYDLCAGDGADEDSSPKIIHKHAKFALKHGVDVSCCLIEKSKLTAQILARNVNGCGFKIHNIDARNFILTPTHEWQGIFVYCDPNHVHEMPMSSQFIASASKGTTYIATLGCNVNGLKRMSRDERMLWYDYVDSIVSSIPSHHDAILISLINDSSQWAYLITVPKKWVNETIERINKIAAKYWAPGVHITQYRKPGFIDHCNKLFLTKGERHD